MVLAERVLAELNFDAVFAVWLACTAGSVVAVVFAVLFLWNITRSALAIDEYTDSIIVTALRILENTAPLVALETTVAVGADLLGAVQAIEGGGAAILAAAAAGPGGGR
ncbi:MAG: hypothetical protein ACRETG_05725 [Steroidobacteraceae bacterium]